MISKPVNIISITVIFIFTLVSAGYPSFEFKESGARAASMGGAYTAVSDDVEAVWWNPAGLRFCREIQVSTEYTRLYGLNDLPYTSFAAVIPTMIAGTWGLGYSSFGPSKYKERDLRFCFASGLGSGIYSGAAVKIQSLKIGDGGGSASTMGLDIGVSANITKQVRMALTSVNINNPKFADTSEGPQKRFMLGLMVKPYEGMSASFDLHKPLEKDLFAKAGIELVLNRMISIRAGTQTNPVKFTCGFGIGWSIFTLKYAFSNHSVLDPGHIFSLDMMFAKQKRERIIYEEEDQVEFRGKLDINTAPVHSLAEIPSLGWVDAKKIAEYREKSGKFRSVRDLLNIYGFSKKKLDMIRKYITVGDPEPGFGKNIRRSQEEYFDRPSMEDTGAEEVEIDLDPLSDKSLPQSREFIPEVDYYEPGLIPQPGQTTESLPEPETYNVPDIEQPGLDLNKANVKELDNIPGITYPLARNIVKFRKNRGNFGDWEDVLKVPGINRKLLENIKRSCIIQ
ncbi:helix-hairpin-helix domain-containing protein [Elusimicrobiota bacterium]